MKKTLIIIAVLAAGWGVYKFALTKNAAKKTVYETAAVEMGAISEIVDTTGEVEPLNRVEVKPAVGGRVDRLLVDEGDFVKRGQMLAYLSSNDRVAILDAARAKGEAEMKYWEDTYKPTPVLSPLNGQVILRNVVQGQTVDMATSLFALADDLIVTANVDEVDIGRVRAGQEAFISLDAYPDKQIRGRVFQILYEGKNVSNVITYVVKIRPYDLPSYFKSQMTANIQIVVAKKENAVLVPSIAVNESSAGVKTVLTGSASGPVPAAVITGLDDGSNTEIISGINEGAAVYYAIQKYVPQRASGASPFMPGKPAQQQSGSKQPQKLPSQARRAITQ